MSATQAELAFQLRDILGPAVTHRELDRLLAQSYGSVQRAVDIYFTNGPDGPVDLPLQEVPGPSSSVAQTVTAPAREGPPRGLRALPPTASPVDFVTLSSSTDNDYDPDATSSDIELNDDEADDAEANNVEANWPVQHNAYYAPCRLLDFETVRDHWAKQGNVNFNQAKLPFPDLRDGSGRLFCSSSDAMPEAASQKLKFPIHLGTFKFPVRMAVKAKAAANKPVPVNDYLFLGPPHPRQAVHYSEGCSVQEYRAAQKSLLAIHQRIMLQLGHKQDQEMKPVAVVPINPNKCSVLGCLLMNLEQLQYRNAIKLKPKLVAGPPHAQLLEAANLNKSCRYSDNMHAAVEVHLLESAVPTLDFVNQVAQRGKGKRKRGDPNQKWQIPDYEMNAVLNWLLMTIETCLAIGPDSDGLLNFCDSKEAADSAETSAAARHTSASGSSKGGNKGSSRGRGKRSSRPSASNPSRVTVQQMLDSVALPDDAAVAVAPAALRTIPKHFQLQGLQWMLAREQLGDALGRGQLHLQPEWIQLVTADKQLLYWHRMDSHFCGSFVPAEVGGTCGGFLCDEMGLGKTLQSLMLILSNPAPQTWPVADLSQHQADEGEAVPIKTTLIVMPANLLQQWQDEIAKHVQDKAVSWCTYDSQASALLLAQDERHAPTQDGTTATRDAAHTPPIGKRTRSQRTATVGGAMVKVTDPLWAVNEEGNAVQMQHQDIALMTYEQLRKELSSSDRSPLLQFGFWRVMLDEAQLVAATSSVAAQMTSSLWRRHAWVVTGTPITSRLGEIQGLLEFLAHEPFYHNDQWHKLLEGPLEGSHPAGSLPLKALMQGVMLRRTKAHVGDQLALPPCEHVEKWVPLSSVEQSFYDRLLKQVLSSLSQYQAAMKRKRGFTSRASQHAVRMVRQFTELRQCCCHPQIVRGATSMLGKGRLSMEAIMERLTAKAYDEYDGKVRAHVVACLLQEAVAAPHGSKPSTAFLEVLQQMMTAVGGASELEVATLIQHRSPDGFLPSLSSDDSQTAAITLPTLLQSRTNRQTEPSTVQDEQIPSGLQRAVSEQPHGATDMQPQGDSEAVAQPVQTNGYAKPESSSDVLRHGDAAKGDVDTLDGTLKSADSSSNTERAAKESGNIVDFLLGQREGQTGATPNSPGHACDSRLHQLPNGLVKSAGQTGPLSNGLANTTAQPDSNPLLSTVVGAQGGILLGQAMTQVNTAEAGLSTLVAKEDMGTGQEQQEAGPSNALPNLDTMQPSEQEAGISQALPDGDMQAGASQALPDQAMRALAEDEPGPSNRAQNGAAVPQQRKRKFASVSSPLEDNEDPEAKEKKESARSRHRAWRKVLLDGLDLLFELSQAAATADPANAELAHDCQAVETEAQRLRSELGLEPELPQLQEAPRFSKRARQMAPETKLEAAAAIHLSKAHAAHLRAAKLILKAYDDLRAKRSSRHSAALAVKSSQEALKAKWRTVQHLYHKQLDATAQAKGKAVAPALVASGQTGEVLAQEDVNTCPICLDECASRTVTACGHYYCSACIHELVDGGGQGSGVPCPLCRAPLQAGDLYDAVTDEEAEEARRAASVQGDYGSKVSTLLLELAAMKQADPTAKAVVFSSWSRLLRLVEEALSDNGFAHTSIAGVQASSRAAALKRFLTDPDCAVLTVIMSTGGGASGLTLTVASHIFLMEPNLNPGLEAQAAGRVYRLGQTKPTRVIRLLTEGTIEKALLAYQRSKVGSANQQADQLQEQELLAGNTLADLLEAHP